MVQFLIEQGADPNVKTGDVFLNSLWSLFFSERTPLEISERRGAQRIKKLLDSMN
jgi:ankyrin repeat protein